LLSIPSRWLALLAFVFAASATAQDATIEAIDLCLAQIEASDAEGVSGLKQIETNCPDLKSTLEHSPYAAWFPEEWWGPALTTDSLAELRDHMVQLSQAQKSRVIDTGGVAEALNSLEEELRASKVTWRDRLVEWLRSQFRQEEAESPDWLYKWLDELAGHASAVRVVGYTLFGLIVLAAVWIVINELMAAGVFGERWRRRLRGDTVTGAVLASQAPSLADIEAGDPLNRPSLLLVLLMNALAKRENRAVDTSVTHRELAHRISLEDHSQRSTFGRLLACAERVRYSATLPTRAEIDAVVADSRGLLETLTTPPGNSPA